MLVIVSLLVLVAIAEDKKKMSKQEEIAGARGWYKEFLLSQERGRISVKEHREKGKIVNLQRNTGVNLACKKWVKIEAIHAKFLFTLQLCNIS